MKVSILLLICLLGLANAALPRIVIKGQRMFDPTTKQQFFCRGLAYAPLPLTTTADPLGDLASIQRDIVAFKALNINCIRVYQFFASSNLDASMKALDDAGIYVLLDLFDPQDNVNRANPQWNTELFLLSQAKIDHVKSYTNLLGLIVGNEVTNEIGNTDASAFVKAAIRDVKAYIATSGVQIPVGYATADDANIIDNMQAYFVCGDASSRADFYGINIYRWCANDQTFVGSGYAAITAKYVDYPVPTILTEFGCIIQGTAGRFVRNFTDVPVIFGPQMNQQFSGAIAYEYHTSGNELRPEGNYGIANFTNGDTVAVLGEEGNNLAAQYAAVVNVQGDSTMDNYTPTPKTFNCPARSATWRIAGAVLPPVADVNRCTCLSNQFQCQTAVQSTEDITPELGTTIGGVASFICGNNPEYCANIAANSTTGVFGPFSMCSSLIRTSLLMNYVYQQKGKQFDSCDFGVGASFQEVVTSSIPQACTTKYPGDSADIANVQKINTATSDVDVGNGESNTFKGSIISGNTNRPSGTAGTGTNLSSASSVAFSALFFFSALIATLI
eukprot:TRINITY_DN529_c0_g1_i1.p1 TRINITY_DN529_c0_g1~~TRINITY_DN529_c0_g1_i1.p1  ORF type:complete len:558 (-),score=177.75 TRINITY_DN529_c0_g1_i1:43-1716(-)